MSAECLRVRVGVCTCMFVCTCTFVCTCYLVHVQYGFDEIGMLSHPIFDGESYRCFTIRHNTYYYISNSVSYFKYALVKVTIASAVLIV